MELQQQTEKDWVKISWSGRIISIQPRIRLIRSFDQRSHSYQGYTIAIDGKVGEEERVFTVAIGARAHDKHQFCVGKIISGTSLPVRDSRTEVAEYYKTSSLKVEGNATGQANAPPPWHDIPVSLEVYRARGHRRLDPRTYEAKCRSCMWGCLMPVEIIVDQWNPAQKKYRRETFCYGPKSCDFYKAGSIRKVPGRHGMIWEEEDWVDDDNVSHRGSDE